MKIIPIYKPYIFSIQYDDREENEYDRLFDLWNDITYLLQFFEENKEYLKNETWNHINEPENAVSQVLEEAERLEDLFEELNENSENGSTPDFDSHFHYLDGKYKYEIELIPVKSYGMEHPSLLRMYAIQLEANTYIITGGGIKLADTIQSSPGMGEYILQDIDRVRTFLQQNGILTNEDINEQQDNQL